MGLLQAGAGVKGEFENRLKSVINEVKASPKPIILFIDEAHTLIGAGGPAGGSDAANLLKPALARGELRTDRRHHLVEYKKYFEKDAALARRFQLVKLDEPSVETAILILRGLKSKYEEAHGVIVRDDAIVAAAELSSRYISGRQLPDKAVDLLDTSAARVKILLTAKPDVGRRQGADASRPWSGRKRRWSGISSTGIEIDRRTDRRSSKSRAEGVESRRWSSSRTAGRRSRSLPSRLIASRKELYDARRAQAGPEEKKRGAEDPESMRLARSSRPSREIRPWSGSRSTRTWWPRWSPTGPGSPWARCCATRPRTSSNLEANLEARGSRGRTRPSAIIAR